MRWYERCSWFSLEGELIVPRLTVAVEPVENDSKLCPSVCGRHVSCQTVSGSFLVHLEQVKGVGII